jgi:hypothetical protein
VLGDLLVASKDGACSFSCGGPCSAWHAAQQIFASLHTKSAAHCCSWPCCGGCLPNALLVRCSPLCFTMRCPGRMQLPAASRQRCPNPTYGTHVLLALCVCRVSQVALYALIWDVVSTAPALSPILRQMGSGLQQYLQFLVPGCGRGGSMGLHGAECPGLVLLCVRVS